MRGFTEITIETTDGSSVIVHRAVNRMMEKISHSATGIKSVHD